MSTELSEIQERLRGLREEEAGEQRELRALVTEGLSLGHPEVLRIEANSAFLQREIAQLQLHERRLLDEQSARDMGRAEAEARHLAEERGFWFRRFHTSLAIAHGAALAAIASRLLDPQLDGDVVLVALVPMTVFSVGLVLAGLIPYALYKEQRSTAQALANVSGGLFAGGLVTTLGALALLATPSLLANFVSPI